MKQTAVEWLVSQMKDDRFLSAFEEEIDQAKEMEKQQIMESYNDSTCQFSVDSRIDCPKSAEQYYNEKFKKNKIMKELIIKIPKGYMNVGISTCNKLIADTNDSSNWDEIYFPLPKGEWNIENIDIQTNIIKLIKNK